MARIVATIHVLFPRGYVDTRGRACRRLAQRALSIVVARIVDLEHRWIGALVRIEIVNRNRRVVALRIGHGPLLELHVLGAEHDHQAAVPTMPLFSSATTVTNTSSA